MHQRALNSTVNAATCWYPLPPPSCWLLQPSPLRTLDAAPARLPTHPLGPPGLVCGAGRPTRLGGSLWSSSLVEVVSHQRLYLKSHVLGKAGLLHSKTRDAAVTAWLWHCRQLHGLTSHLHQTTCNAAPGWYHTLCICTRGAKACTGLHATIIIMWIAYLGLGQAG